MLVAMVTQDTPTSTHQPMPWEAKGADEVEFHVRGEFLAESRALEGEGERRRVDIAVEMVHAVGWHSQNIQIVHCMCVYVQGGGGIFRVYVGERKRDV